MLTIDSNDIACAARRMMICYGAHAVDIARERAMETGHAADIRQRDMAFLVLSEVEKLARKGPHTQ
ncbi:hypothetical protein [Paramagnetospirillum kuznetsovii]|nr:hypothetical protein [Paramagnetospirillum kuznetsovii]